MGLSLTPICDIEQSKAETVQFCALYDVWDKIRTLCQTDWQGERLIDSEGNLLPGPLSNTKRGAFNEKVSLLIKQRLPRYHWLAPMPSTQRPPLIADFQVLTSHPLEELGDDQIEAELASPYREQAASRYASYMGRVGTPDFTIDQIETWLAEGARILFPA